MTDIGKIMILPRNAWSNAYSYEILDSVTYNGAAYLSKVNDNLNHMPSGETDSFWFKYAEDGFTPTITQSKNVETGVTTITITNATGTETVQIIDGQDGGSVSIISITKENGVTTIILEDESGQHILTINDGEDGKGIKSFVKHSEGLVDQYTITYTDDTTTVLTVTNGRGISSIVKTSSTPDITGRIIDTYTVTFNDNTTFSYTVTNGKDGTGVGDMEKAVYDSDNDGVVDKAETADSVDWENVADKPFTAIGDTLEVTNVEVDDEQVPTLDAKVMTGATSQSGGASGTVPKPEQGDQDKFLSGNGKWRAISQMTGASATADGQAGMVPTPQAGDNTKVLYGDGTWEEIATMTGATSSEAGKQGEVPAPSAGDNEKFLKGDGTWEEIATMTGATSSKAGAKGLVPAPASGDNEKFLRGDGTWAKADSLGTKLTTTVDGDTVAFTSNTIGDTSIIDGVYIKDTLVGLDDYAFDDTTHTLTFTLTDDSADGKAAIIYVRN